ncbi:MAG: hypothetical protein U0670_04435 [Anaerolineae bacterium]
MVEKTVRMIERRVLRPRIWLLLGLWIGLGMVLVRSSAIRTTAQDSGVQSMCPAPSLTPRGASFQPGGIILTAFDRDSLWVYDIDNDRRYPLPDTAPCIRGCRLSPNFRQLTYYNAPTQAFNLMNLNGTGRTFLTDAASDLEWWGANHFLLWTPGHNAYTFTPGSTDRQDYDVREIGSVQPNGSWGLRLTANTRGDGFTRSLVNFNDNERTVNLGADIAYYNARAWSPDGHTLAYVAPMPIDPGAMGSEIRLVRPDETPNEPTTLTGLYSAYGPVRINGLSLGELSWSPDGLKIAFWVVPLTDADPTVNTGPGTIHVVDVATGQMRSYCGFTTPNVTPNPPRLIWSPDSTNVAFAGDVPGDVYGVLLLALNTETGVFTQLSDGIYPALGQPNVYMWGLPPG